MPSDESNNSPPRDLHLWLWAGVTPIVFAAVVATLIQGEPQLLQLLLGKEVLAEGKTGGLVEHLTVLILVPGIIAGLLAVFFWSRRLPPCCRRGRLMLAGWFLVWSLACIYFAGEEASWGQHALGYDTPQWVTQALGSVGLINDQANRICTTPAVGSIKNRGPWWRYLSYSVGSSSP